MSRARDLADGTFSGAVAAASGDFTGTIEAADLSDGTLTVGTEYVTNGSAKVWVNFNGTGTIAARDSFNVASLTDNGTGDYTVNFTNAMGNGDYAFSGIKQNSAVNTDFGLADAIGTRATTSGRVVSIESGVVADSLSVNLIVQGDLA